MTDEQLRIRSYLQGQGAKLSPDGIIEKVRAAMTELREAAIAVPAARFAERPAPDDWSGNEVMAHVIMTGRRFGDRIVNVLDGAPAGGTLAEPTDATTRRRTADEWCGELERDRAALFARVKRASPTERLDATIAHPFFGELNWRETLLFMRLHDLDHAGQLRKIAEAFGAPRSA